MKTKALLIVLALCMIVSVFAGCSKPYNYDFDKYIKLGDYSGVIINLSEVNKGVKAKFESAASNDKKTNTYSTKTEGIVVEDGDVANINYVGKVDGKEFEGGKADKYDLTIGSGAFIDGFEDSLIGAEVGTTFDIKVTFPSDYGKEGTTKAELNGKEATFTVTINSIKRTTYPEYNDANVKKYFEEDYGYTTVKEFEEGVTEDVKKDLVWEAFFSGNKAAGYKGCEVIKYPEKELKSYYEVNASDEAIATYTYYAQQLGVSVETYLGYMGFSSWEEFFEYQLGLAKRQVKQELIIYAMIDKNPVLKLTEEEYAKRAEELWQESVESGYEGDFKQFKKDNKREVIELSIYYDKVIDYLMETHKVNDDVTKNGLVTDKKGTQYYISDVMQTGWQNIDVDGDGTEDKCYFDTETGYLAVNGAYAIPEDAPEGSTDKLFYKFSDKGVFDKIYHGFYNDGQTIRYFNEGVAYKSGWYEIEGDRYYFFDTTYAATGDVMVKNDVGEDILGRFDKDGKFEMELIGWVETEDGVRYYYKKDDGTVTFATREFPINVTVDGVDVTYTFYFGGKDGYMAIPDKGAFKNNETNEFGAIYEKMYLFFAVEIDGVTRYAIKTGFTGIYTTEGDSYYFIEGVGQFGWQQIDGDTYFFSSKDGKMMKGEQKISDVTYNFGEDGKLTTVLNGLVYDDASNLMYFDNGVKKTGMITVTEGEGDKATTNKYFFGADGFAVLGWVDVEGDGIKDYYSRDYKIVVDQTATIDGVTYKFDADGHFTIENSAN